MELNLESPELVLLILLIFGIILSFIIIYSLKISKKEDKGILASFIVLLGFIGIEIFIENTTIQLLLFICIIALINFTVIGYIAPRLFYSKDIFIFAETKPEIWEEMKINSTIEEAQ